MENKQFQVLDIQDLQAELLTESNLDLPYLILVVGSGAIATFGLCRAISALFLKQFSKFDQSHGQ